MRQTLLYVTDVSPDCWNGGESPGDAYPHVTTQGNSCGFIVPQDYYDSQFRDRASGNNAKLAGLVFHTGPVDYRFDLPAAGDYRIRVAMGDAVYASGPYSLEVFDNTTSLGLLVNAVSTTAANNFLDATGTEYTAANWLTSNSYVTKTFTSTIAIFRWNQISHIYMEYAGPPPVGSLGDFDPELLIKAWF